MSVAFVVTTGYQLFHYKQMAPHVPDAAVVVEVRKRDFAVSEEAVATHLPGLPVETLSQENLKSLDGRYDAVVCQTPVLPLQFFDKTLVVAQQYSLAKERYQYGVWRAHAHLNLMYGQHPLNRVAGFCRAAAVGNPLLDGIFQGEPPVRDSWQSGGGRKRILYMPTYGSLSSVPSVLPALREIDADVTVKLHHAEDRELVKELPEHMRVVYADADPVRLLAEHDGVISDFSGAAFDALYAGLPVVLAGNPDPRGKDFDRLSDDERQYTVLAGVAAHWQEIGGAEGLYSAFADAEKRRESEDYQAFVEEFFVNPGTAGAECGRRIVSLLETGPAPHFAADQVRATTRRYITTNRSLKSQLSRTGRATVARSVVHGLPLHRRAVRRLLEAAGRSRRLVRIARIARRRVRDRRGADVVVDADRCLAAAPAKRREAVMGLLEPFLLDAGLPLVRDDDRPGSDLAVLATDKRRLRRALSAAAGRHPDLVVRLGHQWKLVDTMPLAKLSFHDIAHADWLEVGTPAERSEYVIGPMGYLKVLFVQHEPERNRYLAQKKVAHRVDWSPLFAQCADRTAPVRVAGERLRHAAGPVDVVYTWVDAGDPAWQADRRRYDGETSNASAANPERFLDRQELRYSLRALELFAPFVRHVYIVTADQRPAWLAPDHPKITVVSHRDVFPDASVLPTFNSHAIEACLHRIPGLSENFVYFNDDVLLGQECDESDFFTIAGQAKVRLSPSQYIYQGRPEDDAIPTDWAAYNSLRLMSNDFDITLDRRVKHVPLVLKRSVLADIEKRYPEEVAATRAARFRSNTDVAIPSMFAQYYGMATGSAVEWPGARNEYVYLDTGRADSLDRFQQILQRPPKFYCLNTTRHTEVDLARQARNLARFFTAALPEPAEWEIPDR
ncbi:Stealth-like protein [Stackebrandtia albiflava]|uniref:Stealth-like protein n=1 Tax=Stackebrandtia albiflava TaxID=406432 RepID=A0A562V360_9ACTN|nr:stealth conserved region 3 domain-containing protein [Stackebrandtia albiflava]TWJ12330.1 Stealth-like protein [Stackebrandtia albiflava]